MRKIYWALLFAVIVLAAYYTANREKPAERKVEISYVQNDSTKQVPKKQTGFTRSLSAKSTKSVKDEKPAAEPEQVASEYQDFKFDSAIIAGELAKGECNAIQLGKKTRIGKESINGIPVACKFAQFSL